MSYISLRTSIAPSVESKCEWVIGSDNESSRGSDSAHTDTDHPTGAGRIVIAAHRVLNQRVVSTAPQSGRRAAATRASAQIKTAHRLVQNRMFQVMVADELPRTTFQTRLPAGRNRPSTASLKERACALAHRGSEARHHSFVTRCNKHLHASILKS